MSFIPFIILTISQLFSILGSAITSFAISTYIYEYTGAVTPLALSLLFAIIPYLVLGPFIGNLCDRLNKKHIIIISDGLCALCAATLFILSYKDTLMILLLYIIVFCSSTFNMANFAAFQSSIPHLVGRDKLKQANGIAQVIDSASSLIAPIIAGFVYLKFGFSFVVLIEVFTFFIALPIIILVPKEHFILPDDKGTYTKQSLKGMMHDSGAGFRFIKEHKGLMFLLVIFAVDNMFSQIVTTYITPMILDLGNVGWLGILQAVSGGSMLLGGLIISVRPKKGRYIKAIFILQLLSACMQILFGLQNKLLFVILVRGIYCFMAPIINAYAITLWQLKTPNKLQGRVFIARQFILRLLIPISYLSAGPLVDYFAPWALNKSPWINNAVTSSYQFTIVFAGCILLLCVLFVYSNKCLRDADNIPSPSGD